MIDFEEPDVLHKPWVMSNIQGKKQVLISEDTTRYLRRYHIQGIDFLYQNYRQQFKGAILNEENGFNMQLQVSAFLNSILNNCKGKFIVLVICPDNLIVNWHYHLTSHGKLKVEIVEPTTCPADFDEEDAIALLLPFSAIRLAEPLANFRLLSVIIDHFDMIATKRIMYKLYGDFNIGLTERNFYVNPDQRLQWLMLNWCNQGCVGRLSDFYSIDNDNFATYRDNYRHWWFRLTWSFCDAFKKISDAERKEYARTISQWSIDNNIIVSIFEDKKRKNRSTKNYNQSCKRTLYTKSMESESVEHPDISPTDSNTHLVSISSETNAAIPSCSVSKQEKEIKVLMESMDSEEQNKKKWSPFKTSNNLNQSCKKTQDTKPTKSEPVEDPDVYPTNSNTICGLTSSETNIATPSVSKQENEFQVKMESVDTEQSSYSQNNDEIVKEENVLIDIINDQNPSVSPTWNQEARILYKKEELLSQVYHDNESDEEHFSTSTNNLADSDEDKDFFRSLI